MFNSSEVRFLKIKGQEGVHVQWLEGQIQMVTIPTHEEIPFIVEARAGARRTWVSAIRFPRDLRGSPPSPQRRDAHVSVVDARHLDQCSA